MTSVLLVDTIKNSLDSADTVAFTGGIHSPGSIVQVKHVRRNADISTTSSTYTDVDSLSFTPKFANSRLELYLNYSAGRNGSSAKIQWQFYDDTNSNVLMTSGQHIGSGATDADPGRHTLHHYHDVSSTNTVTYKVRGRNPAGSGTVWFHTYGGSTYSYFTIREIAR